MRVFKSENGSVLILTAVVMAIILCLVGLIIDGGSLYVSKSKLQKALDAAVLSGAQDLPGQPDKASQEAENTVNSNGMTGVPTIDFNSDYTSIHAAMTDNQSILFSQLLGIQQVGIQASAKVQLFPLTSAMGAIPLGVIDSTPFVYGNLVTLKVGTSSTGNFGALALSGTGAKDYETDLTYGLSSALSVGTVVDTQTGNITKPTQRAIQYRISSCSSTATYTDYPVDCTRVVLVPVYEPVPNGQNQMTQVTIVGFASFFLESVEATNDGATVLGRFIQRTYAGTSSPSQTAYGAYGYRLVE